MIEKSLENAQSGENSTSIIKEIEELLANIMEELEKAINLRALPDLKPSHNSCVIRCHSWWDLPKSCRKGDV